MKSESDAITDDEWLLRRVHRDRFRIGKMPFISPGAFEPRLPEKCRDPDIDGISLYRESCLANPEACLLPVAAEKRSEWGIVRILAAEIRRLGMSVNAAHDEQIPGHVVIPELSATAFVVDRDGCKKRMHDMAVAASAEINVVSKPAHPA